MSDADADDFKFRVIQSVAKVILDESARNAVGGGGIEIHAVQASEALVAVIGMLLEGAPQCQSPQGIRKLSEVIGRTILSSIKTAQKVRLETGTGPFGATINSYH